MNTLLRILFCAILALPSSPAIAAPPATINYQGTLANAGGTPVNGNVVMTFRLYAAASGGSAIYSETQLSVGVANGNFNAVIGSVSPVALPFDAPYWLTVAINADPEMSPRQPLTSSPYAFRASMLDSSATISGAQITGSVASAGSANVATTAMMALGLMGTLPGSQISGAITNATIPAAQITGTLGSAQLAATQRLPTVACAVNEIAQWNGSAWGCATASSGNSGNITGNLTMVNSTATAGNVLKGGERFLHNFGDQNTFVGLRSGNFTMSGVQNTAIGTDTLPANETGNGNVALGLFAMSNNTTGESNTAIGTGALSQNVSGARNTSVGYAANSVINTTGSDNIALGFLAGSALGNGSNFNILVGNSGTNSDSGIIRLGNVNQTRTFIAGVLGVTPGIAGDALLPVVVAPNGQFGTLAAFPAGPAGPAGPQGPQGAQGPQGPAGPNDITGNLTMLNSTVSAGNILKSGTQFIHNFGTRNTFVGVSAGNFTMTGTSNTGSGVSVLASNTTGDSNTAIGRNALAANTTGSFNTASGHFALGANTTGISNTASGTGALQINTIGNANTASGVNALRANTTGDDNTASGLNALFSNTTGIRNTASGHTALQVNTTGSNNTATGTYALGITTGNNNIAIGSFAGSFLTTGNNNIAIGNQGVAADNNTMRLGAAQTRTFVAGISGVTPALGTLPVVIDSNGQLGTGAAVAGGVTNIATGVGLTGGPITSTGTINLASTQLLPIGACASNQIPKWNGSAWTCAADADTNSGGTVTSITAGGGLTGGTITGAGTISIDPTSAVLTDNFFKFGGNSFGATAVLGSTTNVAVEIIANGARALRIEPNATSPNIAHGHSTNTAGGTGIVGATVSGGGLGSFPNSATNSYAIVAGGFQNVASGAQSTVSGGASNNATVTYATVGGGQLNNSTGGFATVGGGIQNTASGAAATVPGGQSNQASGSNSFAAGFRARALLDGCFAWADISVNADFNCLTSNAFMARATGGVQFYTNTALTNGCSLAPGGGAWACTSSRETKKDFTAMNPLDVLKRVIDLPVTQWRYQAEVSGARHVGPMAEDFHAAFGLGDSDKTINVIDASGVALAAIQGLNQLVEKKNAEIQTQNRRIKLLEDALASIQVRLGMR